MTNQMERGLWHRSRLLVFVVLLGLAAAACGNDDSATPAATGDGVESDADGEVSSDSAAAALVEDFTTRPLVEDFGFDTPIEGEIPSGLEIWYITCGPEACQQMGKIVSEAAEVLGWTSKDATTDGSPESTQAAWQQVIRANPDGVIYTGTNRSQIEPYIRELEALGVPIAACCIQEEPGDGVIWTSFTANDFYEQGVGMAAWIVSDAEAKGSADPGVVYVDLPEFDVVLPLREGFESTIADLCQDCVYENLPVALANLADLPNLVVSYLRANPDTKYIAVAADSIATGVPSAVLAAGIDGVQMVGNRAKFREPVADRQRPAKYDHVVPVLRSDVWSGRCICALPRRRTCGAGPTVTAVAVDSG